MTSSANGSSANEGESTYCGKMGGMRGVVYRMREDIAEILTSFARSRGRLAKLW